MLRFNKIALAVVTLSVGALAGAQDVHVNIDGTKVNFPNAQPQKIHGRVLVPMRRIFEQLGATVSWNRDTQAVTAEKGGKTIDLTIGKHIASVDGSEVRLDVPAMVIDGSTMVPIRFVSEALGAQVGWLEAKSLVSIEDNMNGRPMRLNKSATTRTEFVPEDRTGVIAAEDEVIPVVLDTEINNINNSKGDTFTAMVRTGNKDYYGRIPKGTQVFGHIANVVPRKGSWPPVVDLAFDKIVFPDGDWYRIYGNLISLDDHYVTTKKDGTLEILNSKSHMSERMVYAGFGGGSGRLVPVLETANFAGPDQEDSMRYITSHVAKSEKSVSDIKIERGTQLGIRLTKRIASE